MFRVGGTAAIPEQENLLALPESLGHLFCNLNNRISLFSQVGAQGCALTNLLSYHRLPAHRTPQDSLTSQLCIPRRSKVKPTIFPPALSNFSATICHLSNSQRK